VWSPSTYANEWGSMNGGRSPKVSVILPTHNRADLLPGSVESVLEQGYEDLELIVVDDGSTDHTASMLREFEEEDERVSTIFLAENRGVYFARDVGWRRARGEYVAWADSDDRWLPGKLEAQVAAMDAWPEIDILFGDYLNYDHRDGSESTLFENCRPALEQLTVRRLDEGLFVIEGGMERALLAAVFVSLPTALFRADVVRKAGSFDVALRNAGDLEYFWRAALLSARYAYQKRRVMERHKVASSMTADRARAWRGVLEVYRRCTFWCDRLNRVDLLEDVRHAQQRAYRNLIGAYGNGRRRREAWRAFRQSLTLGFSARTVVYVGMALLGPGSSAALRRLVTLWRE